MTTFKNLISLIIDIFIRPSRSFDKIKEGSYLGWALLILAAYGILIQYYRFYNFNSGILETIQILSDIVVVFPFSVYIGAKLLDSKSKYLVSIQVYIYSLIPYITLISIKLILYILNIYLQLSDLNQIIKIFSWVENVIFIWILLLFFIGIKIIYGFTNKQAVRQLIIYFIIAAILHFTFYFYVIRPGQIAL